MGTLDDHIKARQAEMEETNIEEASAVETVESTEATTEETPTVVIEGENQTTTEETPVVEPEVVEYNDEQLNTFFGTTGKTKEDLKSVFSLGDKYSELEKTHDAASQELESVKAQNLELKKGLDPLSYFSSDEAYVAEQLRKKYPKMDPVAIQTAMTKDLDQMTDLDVLALQDVIKRPGLSGGEVTAKKILAADYGVDLEEATEEWDDIAKERIRRAAYDAREEIKTFQSEVELPSAKSDEDLQAERSKELEDLRAQWGTVMPEMQKFDKISIPGKEEGQFFEFEVDQEFKDGLGEYFDIMITNGELEPNEETVQFLREQRNKEFVYQNLDKIIAAHESDLRSKLTQQTDEELNNTTPANTQEAPVGGEEISGAEKHLRGQPGGRRNY
jgi:hypothetical protein